MVLQHLVAAVSGASTCSRKSDVVNGRRQFVMGAVPAGVAPGLGVWLCLENLSSELNKQRGSVVRSTLAFADEYYSIIGFSACFS